MKTCIYFSTVIMFLHACYSPTEEDKTQRKDQRFKHDLMLSNRQIRLANITTQQATIKAVGQTVVATGRLTINQQYSNVASSRVSGRVEKLFIKEPGRLVKKGEPLYQIFSETLITLQQEYLLAKQQYDTLGHAEIRYKSYLKASEKKLLLLGLSKNQLNMLAQTQSIQQVITFLAPTSGFISEINVSEGQYITEGTPMYKLEDISHLWLEAELYAHETSLTRIGDKVSGYVAGYESHPIQTQVTFLSPEYKGGTQVVIIRADIDNPDLKFTPGSSAQVSLSQIAKKTLAIPTNAVIRNKHRTVVYVQRGKNTFRPQMVKTGIEDFDDVEITAGLSLGDTVVITGAYLLQSETILKDGMDALADLEITH